MSLWTWELKTGAASFREKSRTSLLYAAGIRKDRLSVFLSENGADPAVPRGFYHRKCYQNYTHKDKLERLATALAQSNGDDKPGPSEGQLAVSSSSSVDIEHTVSSQSAHCGERDDASSISRSTTRLTRSKVDKTSGNLCLFCQQEQKKVKGIRQSLSSCMTLEACDAIYNAAYVRGDERVLLEVLPGQPDLIAKEISYHRTCYMKYTQEISGRNI